MISCTLVTFYHVKLYARLFWYVRLYDSVTLKYVNLYAYTF